MSEPTVSHFNPQPAPPPQPTPAKPWYTRWWSIALFVLCFVIVIGAVRSAVQPERQSTTAQPTETTSSPAPAPTKPSATATSEPQAQAKTAEATTEPPASITPTPEPPASISPTPEPPADQDAVPAEYRTALRSAENYLSMMPFSKAGLFDQLSSEYGEKFSVQAAQYAVDHVQTDWKDNALRSARLYEEQMHMSPRAIYDQLVSDYGEKYTAEEAQWAIDNLHK